MSLHASVLTDFNEPKIDQVRYDAAVRLISAFDEKREITRYGRHTEYENISSVRSAVLVFLPGLGEIEIMHKCLVEYENNAPPGRKNYWYILPLHSRVTSEEQSRVFQPASTLPQDKRHCRKIILSTNIAESSLTVPDITYVIDFCLVKQLVADPETNFCSLKVHPTSLFVRFFDFAIWSVSFIFLVASTDGMGPQVQLRPAQGARRSSHRRGRLPDGLALLL